MTVLGNHRPGLTPELTKRFNFNTICFITDMTDSVTWEAYSTWVKIEQKIVHCLCSVTSDDPGRIPSPELEGDTALQLYTSPLQVE